MCQAAKNVPKKENNICCVSWMLKVLQTPPYTNKPKTIYLEQETPNQLFYEHALWEVWNLNGLFLGGFTIQPNNYWDLLLQHIRRKVESQNKGRQRVENKTG